MNYQKTIAKQKAKNKLKEIPAKIEEVKTEAEVVKTEVYPDETLNEVEPKKRGRKPKAE